MLDPNGPIGAAALSRVGAAAPVRLRHEPTRRRRSS
jgi:hypothetical protein